MRISTSMIFELSSSKISDLQSTLIKTQQQLSTQRRVLTPADDPVASASILNITQTMSVNEQFATNRQNGKNLLQQQESVLSSVTQLLQDVKTLTIQAGNGSMEDSQRQYLASELRGRFEELLGLANSRDGAGNYMFSGYQIGQQPFSQTPGGAAYTGDQGKRMLQIGASRQIALNDSGSSVFEQIKTGNGTFVTAQASQVDLTTMTPVMPASVNTGSGIVSSGAVSDGSKLTGHDYSIVFSSLQNTVSYAVLDNSTGKYLDPNATPSWVAGPPTAPTLGTPQPPGWQPYVSGQAIAFDGLQLEIKGTPANGDAFSVKPSASQSIFTTLDNLLTTLSTNAVGASGQARLTNGLSAANDNIDNTLNKILEVRASLGTRLSEIDVLDSTGDDLNVQYTGALHDLQDIDLAKAISNFTQQQQALDAAQKSFMQISHLSLFNYI